MWTSSRVPRTEACQTPGRAQLCQPGPVTVDLAPSAPAAWGCVAAGTALALGAWFAGAGAASGGGTDGTAGLVLAVPAGVLLMVLGLRDALLRPALALGPQGLVVLDGWTRRAVDWRGLERARVVTDRRAALLELDLGDVLVVLSRRRLGVPPWRALELLEQVRDGRVDDES